MYKWQLRRLISLAPCVDSSPPARMRRLGTVLTYTGPRCHTTAGAVPGAGCVEWRAQNAGQRRDAWPSTCTASAGVGVQGANMREPAASQVPSAATRGLHRPPGTFDSACSTCTSATETPGFPRASLPAQQEYMGHPLSEASVKETLDSCVQVSKKSALPLCCPGGEGWKLHPPKRAWYQDMVARVWAANRAIPVRRYGFWRRFAVRL